MPDPGRAVDRLDAGRGEFATTHWSVILAARESGGPQTAMALEALCRTYWPPLYVYIRRKGYDPHEAEDLTQAFFARFIEKDYLNAVSPVKGRFRSFLLACINHFLSDERDRARAQKRGGGQPEISLQARKAEEYFRLELAHNLTPERLFERRWAKSLVSSVFDRLAQDYAATGKEDLFRVAQEFLSPDSPEANYTAAARELGMQEGALRMAVHRIRRRYGELFRQAVAQTVADASDVEDEMRELRRILSE